MINRVRPTTLGSVKPQPDTTDRTPLQRLQQQPPRHIRPKAQGGRPPQQRPGPQPTRRTNVVPGPLGRPAMKHRGAHPALDLQGGGGPASPRRSQVVDASAGVEDGRYRLTAALDIAGPTGGRAVPRHHLAMGRHAADTPATVLIRGRRLVVRELTLNYVHGKREYQLMYARQRLTAVFWSGGRGRVYPGSSFSLPAQKPALTYARLRSL